MYINSATHYLAIIVYIDNSFELAIKFVYRVINNIV